MEKPASPQKAKADCSDGLVLLKYTLALELGSGGTIVNFFIPSSSQW